MQASILNGVLEKFPGNKVNDIKTAIERLKRQGIYPGVKDEKVHPGLIKIFTEYQLSLKESNWIDYSDLIYYTISLLESSRLAHRLITNHFRYLLVDEFQDTDGQQLKLIEILARNTMGTTIVADDDQSIFGWRGANRKNVEILAKRLGAETVPLGVNFRSDQVIVDAANKVIQKDANRFQKKISAASKDFGKIAYKKFQNYKEEGESLSSLIKKLVENKELEDLGDVAIISRVRWRADIIREMFDLEKINWFDRSRLSFEESWDALLALDILNLSLNLDSSNNLYALMSTIESTGLAMQLDYEDALDLTLEICNMLKASAAQSIRDENANSILLSSGYLDLVKKVSWSDTEANNRLKNIEKLTNELVDLKNKLNLCLEDAVRRLAGSEAVQFLTGQESKGREFRYVFFVGLEEGVLPDKRSLDDEKLAEERRIFYVGLTRAKKAAYLTSVSNPTDRWGRVSSLKPSRFISHIPEELFTEFE
jgi:superfamily I DNA/RNA helicase